MSEHLGQRLHERAVAILAGRNRIRGRAPNEYTDAAYLQAVAEAEAELTAAASSADEEFADLLARVLRLREKLLRARVVASLVRQKTPSLADAAAAFADAYERLDAKAAVDVDFLREQYESQLAEARTD